MANSPLRSSGPGQPVHGADVDVELGDQPVQHVGRIDSSTSSRTAGSNRRRISSRSIACSRFSVRSSSTSRSLIRVTRNT